MLERLHVRLLMVRHWIKVLLMYRTLAAYYHMKDRWYKMVSLYWQERTYLNFHYSRVAGALDSTLHEQRLVLDRFLWIAKWSVKNYPSTRRLLRSGPWPERDFLDRLLARNTPD